MEASSYSKWLPLVARRCTGYRPILDGFQTFAKGGINSKLCTKATKCRSGSEKDIEEIGEKLSCYKSRPTRSRVTKEGVTWIRLATLQELYSLLRISKEAGERIRIVRGNTMFGVYRPAPADFIVEISEVPSLMKVSVSEDGVAIGGALPIADFMKVLEEHRELSPSYEPLLNHLKKVSHPTFSLAAIKSLTSLWVLGVYLS